MEVDFGVSSIIYLKLAILDWYLMMGDLLEFEYKSLFSCESHSVEEILHSSLTSGALVNEIRVTHSMPGIRGIGPSMKKEKKQTQKDKRHKTPSFLLLNETAEPKMTG